MIWLSVLVELPFDSQDLARLPPLGEVAQSMYDAKLVAMLARPAKSIGQVAKAALIVCSSPWASACGFHPALS